MRQETHEELQGALPTSSLPSGQTGVLRQPEEEGSAQRTRAGFLNLSSDSVEWLASQEGRDEMRALVSYRPSP